MWTGVAYRLIGLAVVAVSAFVAGIVLGAGRERNAWTEREKVRLSAEAEAKRLEALMWARNSERVAEIVRTVTVEVERIRVVNNTIRERVEVYVPADSPDLPAGWRVLHDAAARGEEPNPSAASGADAAPVSAQDAARTVIENYGACLSDQERLRALQDYVRGVVGASEGQQ